MEYDITMPILSDTMESGKLIKWHVKPGDRVQKGDVVAEVESDKAIMEVQTFKEGVVKELKAKEGDEVPVKSVIAVIDTSGSAAAPASGTTTEKAAPSEAKPHKAPEPAPRKPETEEIPEKPEKPEPAPAESAEETNPILEILQEETPSAKPVSHIPGVASPAAKRRADELGVEIEALQQEGKIPTPAHTKDVESAWMERYFTPAAKALIQRFAIDPQALKRGHKVDKEEVLSYIRANQLREKIGIPGNQQAVIAHIEKSAQKPIYHIYDRLDLSLVPEREGVKLTSWIVRIFADTMMAHPLSRTIYHEGAFYRYESANIAIAVATEEALYTPVITNAQQRSVAEINDLLKEIKEKAKTNRFVPQDFEHSTFGISNLGMFGIDAFDALINHEDSAMAAIGAEGEDRSVSLTVTFDHRIMNGKDGALFVHDLKMRAQDRHYLNALAKQIV